MFIREQLYSTLKTYIEATVKAREHINVTSLKPCLKKPQNEENPVKEKEYHCTS